MKRYTLSRPAQQDLVAIRDFYLESGGLRAARRIINELAAAFRVLARNPNLGHTRRDLAGNRPVLFWPMRDYLVIYRAAAGRIEIVTIIHGHRDVAMQLNRIQ